MRSAGGTLNSGNRNDSKVHLHSATSIVNDEEQQPQQQQQQQIQVAFSQQLICNPKILIIQGSEYNYAYGKLYLRLFLKNIMIMKNKSLLVMLIEAFVCLHR